MIRLTRLRQNTPFILNPDHIERVDTHVDTVVRLTTGAEYVVNETGEDIVRMTIDYRARVLAAAGRMAIAEHDPEDAPPARGPADPVAHEIAEEIVEAAEAAEASSDPVTEAGEPAAEEVAS